MIVLLNQSGNTTYGLRKYILDTEADVENLPTENILMGSEATVIDSGKKYIFSSKRKEWLLDKSSASGGTAGIGSTGEQIKVTVVDGVIQAKLLDSSIGRDKINETFETDLSNLEKNAAAAQEKLTSLEEADNQLQETDTELAEQIRTVKEQVNNIDVSSQINSAISALNLANTYAEKSKVDALIADDEGKSARTIANEELAKQLIPENANESLDTLKEIADWIQNHPNDVTAINTAIGKLQEQVGTNDPASGLIKDVKDLQKALGDTSSIQDLIDKSVTEEANRIDNIVGTPDEGKTIQQEIEELRGYLPITEDEIDFIFGISIVDGKYYVDGQLATGTYKGKYYINGELADGLVEDTLYDNGVQASYYMAPYLDQSTKDLKAEDKAFYYLTKGKKSNFTGWCDTSNPGTVQNISSRYYINGKTATGIYNELYIKNGLLTTGVYKDKFYLNGIWQPDFTGVYWMDYIPENKFGINELPSGYYVKNGIWQSNFTGLYNDYFIVNGELGTGIYNNTYYIGGINYEVMPGVGELDNPRGIYNCNYPEKFVGTLNKSPTTGIISGYYIKDNVFQPDFTGKYNNYYIENGIAFTGIYDNKYYEQGRFQQNYSNDFYNDKYYLINGIVQTDLTGTYTDKYKYKCYNIVDGIVQTGFTGIWEDKCYYNGHTKNGIYNNKLYSSGNFRNYTGLTQDYDTNLYYYVKDGIWQSDFTGLYNNNFIKDGIAFTGIYNDEYYKDGRKGTGFYNDKYYSSGKILKGPDFIYYGKNNIVQYYIKDGSIYTDYTGIKNSYYVNKGIVYSIYGVIDDKFYKNGHLESGIYEDKYYLFGIWQSDFTGRYNDNYIEKGILKTDFTDVYKNYYYKNGRIFNGIYNNDCYNRGEKINGFFANQYYIKGKGKINVPYVETSTIERVDMGGNSFERIDIMNGDDSLLVYFTDGNLKFGIDKYGNTYYCGHINYKVEEDYIHMDFDKFKDTIEFSLNNVPGPNDNTIKYFWFSSSLIQYSICSITITFKNNPNIKYHYIFGQDAKLNCNNFKNMKLLENNSIYCQPSNNNDEYVCFIGFTYVNEDDVGKSLDFSLTYELKKPSNNNS